MRNLLILLLLLLFARLSANDTTYYAALRNSLALTDREYSIPAYRSLANTCERIIAVLGDEWLPVYYRGYAYVHLGYMTRDEMQKEAWLDLAEESVDMALLMNPNEVENQLLQALVCFGRLEINPIASALIYIPKATAALDKAKEMDPSNPRIWYLEGKILLNKPEYMGGGAGAALPVLEKALFCYRRYPVPFDLFPDWGEGDARSLYQECKGKIAEK